MSFGGGPVNLITEINETDNDLTLYKSKHWTKVRRAGAPARAERAGSQLFTQMGDRTEFVFSFFLNTKTRNELI